MRITSVIFCLFWSSFAWLLPERCEQGKTARVRGTHSAAATNNAVVEPNVEDIAAQQDALLKETYRHHQFYGIPIRIENHGSHMYTMYTPYNCTFYTYAPRLLSSVACHSSACKLTHTVSTVDTYAAYEGYNWGVKISTKASLPKIFEVGGEVSTGGTYTCTYTKGSTTTDTVECSESSGKGGYLQLYNVKSDLECDFGRITLERDGREKKPGGSRDWGFVDVTESEVQEIEDSRIDSVLSSPIFPYSSPNYGFRYMIDTSKISDSLLQKIMEESLFNPYTDMVSRSANFKAIFIWYYKKTKFVQQYRKIIPFTTEGGDSVFQYACMFT